MGCPAIMGNGKVCGAIPGNKYAHTGYCGRHYHQYRKNRPDLAANVVDSSERDVTAHNIVMILSELAKTQAPKSTKNTTLESGKFGVLDNTGDDASALKAMLGRSKFRYLNSQIEKQAIMSGDDVELWLGYGWVVGKKDGKKVRFPAVRRKCRLANGEYSFSSEIIVHDALEAGDIDFDTMTKKGLDEWIQETIDEYLDEPDVTKKPRVVQHNVVLYIADKSKQTTSSIDLERWSKISGLESTALAKMYAASEVDASDDLEGEVVSLLPLNPSQREAILKARESDITAISGPPGCGKSHTLVALAIDSLANGETVLIATQNEHAQKAILEILQDVPEIPHLVFGNPDYASLNSQIDRMRNASSFRFTEEELVAQQVKVAELEEMILSALQSEEDVERAMLGKAVYHLVDDIGSKLREENLDIEKVQELLAQAGDTSGFMGGVRERRRAKKLRKLVGAVEATSIEDIEDAVAKVISHSNMQKVISSGGLDLTDIWRQLALSQDRLDTMMAENFSRELRHNSNSDDWAKLAGMKYTPVASDIDFLKVAPLWIGTLSEIEETLPNAAGMFDLVILDEASQISQVGAAPALLRANKAIIIGDEKQLDHVSFVSGESVERAVAAHPVPPEVEAKLDVRGASAMAVASDHPLTWLEEHFRSTPHIIDFSNQHFYEGSLKMMTAHPSNEIEDAIDFHYMNGDRVNGVNRVEVEAALERLKMLRDAGERSVGVVTPFRNQAEAIMEAAMNKFSLEEVRNMGLRISTVHGFQGSEREHIVLSLGISDTKPSDLRFVQDPNLFNVMVTRAKDRMHVLSSVQREDLPAGLLRSYMEHADGYEKKAHSAYTKRVWTSKLEDMLSGSGCRVISDYATGNHTIDLVVGTGENAIAVETAIHPEGPGKHLERRQALEKAGWSIVEAYQSKWFLDEAEAAIYLMDEAGFKAPEE